jgi:hypothetical protein
VQADPDCRVGLKEVKQWPITFVMGHFKDVVEVTNGLVTVNDHNQVHGLNVPLFLEVLTDDFENIQCVAYDETILVTGYWMLDKDKS